MTDHHENSRVRNENYNTPREDLFAKNKQFVNKIILEHNQV
jgi:hypothetical protein